MNKTILRVGDFSPLSVINAKKWTENESRQRI